MRSILADCWSPVNLNGLEELVSLFVDIVNGKCIILTYRYIVRKKERDFLTTSEGRINRVKLTLLQNLTEEV